MMKEHTLKVLAQWAFDGGLYKLQGEVLKSFARISSSSSALPHTSAFLPHIVPKSLFELKLYTMW